MPKEEEVRLLVVAFALIDLSLKRRQSNHSRVRWLTRQTSFRMVSALLSQYLSGIWELYSKLPACLTTSSTLMGVRLDLRAVEAAMTVSDIRV